MRDMRSLAEGVMPMQAFQIFATARCTLRFSLEGHERVTWNCHVLDNYDIVLSTKVCQLGPESWLEGKSREVTERERASDFRGFVDLGREHRDWLGGDNGECLFLVLEFDNTFSFFTGKTVELQLTKTSGNSAAGIDGVAQS